MAEINSSISGTQSGGFATKDKVLNQAIGRQSSIKSGASSPKGSGGGIASEYFNQIAEKSVRTGDRLYNALKNFTNGLSFENGIPDEAYEI